jgi:hypothetical protein
MPSFFGGFAEGLSPGLTSAASQYKDDRQQGQFADAMMDAMKEVPGAVPEDVLAKYNKMSGKEKSAAVLAAQFRVARMSAAAKAQDDEYKRAEQIANTNTAKLHYAQSAAGPTTGTVLNPATGQPVNTITLGPGNTQILKDQPQAQPPGTIFKDATGKTRGVWGPDGKVHFDPAPNPFFSMFGAPAGGDNGEMVSDPNAGAAAPQASPGATAPAPAASPAAAPAAGARVQVRSPDGKVGSIPAAQLPAALQAGYTQI